MKKFTGSKNVAVSVKLDMMEVMGSAVVDKDMVCVHWTMKGLRGRENSGDTDNVRAIISGAEAYPVARFPDVFAGTVHARPRKDGNGYDAMELDLRATQPALHKKDDKTIGKAIINIFEKVPTLSDGQPYKVEQTCPLVKDGTAVIAVKITLLIGDEVPAEAAEPETPTSPTNPAPPEPEVAPAIVVKTPPATPQKDAGSESGSTATPDGKEETTSKRSHRKRRSSNSSAMAAVALKKKEEEMKQKEAEFEEEKKNLNAQLAEKSTEVENLKQANQHLETRVKELEQSKEQTDVVPINPAEEKMQEDLRRIQAQNEEMSEQKMALLEQKEASDKKVAELTQALEAAQKELEEAKKQPGTTSGDDSKDKELALLKEQLAELKAELGKKDDSKDAAAAPAKSNIMMQAIIGAVGALLGIILGRMF